MQTVIWRLSVSEPTVNRWGTFPSFSLGWRIDQEEFYKDWNQNVLSAVKLRGGWGQIGNQNIPSFAYADVVSTYDTWVYGFNSGLNLLKAYASTSKGNKDISGKQWSKAI